MKKVLKKIWEFIWQNIRDAFPIWIMYCTAGMLLLFLTMQPSTNLDNEEIQMTWDSSKLLWTIVCVLCGAVYNVAVAWAHGGTHYEMLVSGNIKRISASGGVGYKISKHKEVQEYRVWKGFVIGAFASVFFVAIGILFGINQTAIDAKSTESGISALTFVGFFLSGWTLLPMYYLNASGAYVNYFLSCIFALLPVLVTGGVYIVGAYARRNKAVKEQKKADLVSKKEEKPKKINYGGLPGTKPKKRK